MQELIYYATLAPSAHNNQPWRFQLDQERIFVRLDRSRLLHHLDPSHHQSYISIGAAIENLCIAARCRHWHPEVQLFPNGEADEVVAAIHLRQGAEPTELDRQFLQAIPKRHTARKAFSNRRIPREVIERLQKAALEGEAKLSVLDEREAVGQMARLIGWGDAICFNHAQIQQEVYSWMRFSQQEVAEKQDGLWIKTFSPDPMTGFLSRGLLRWETLRVLNRAGVHRLLGQRSVRLAKHSAAISLLSIPARSKSGYLNGGRTFQRIALQATLDGVMLHPMNSVPITTQLGELFAEQLTPEQRQEVAELNRRFRACFPELGAEEGLVTLLRMGYAEPGKYREPRLAVERVLV